MLGRQMAKTKFLLVVLALGLMAAPTLAAGDQRTDAAIKAYAAQQEAARQEDIRQRIAARPELNTAPTVMGNPMGDVTIVEFFDYTCPYCKALEPRLEALLKSDRKVKLVLKEFPILTPQSVIATRAALAATRQGKYGPYHQAMMRFEGQLTEADIFDIAKASGLNVARLKVEMGAPWIADEIIANFNSARAIRAFQTPTFIVNGRRLGDDSAAIDFPREVAAARHARH